jgi:hypothetical protein
VSIKLNTLIKWLVPEGSNTDERVERVLWIDSKTTQVIVIQMTDERVLPFLRPYEEIASALATGNAHIQTSDSYIANIRADEQLSTKARERRDRNWELIRPIVDGGVDLMISPKRRGPIITKHAEICGRQKSEIYDLLRCFWWTGGIKNSLATDFHKCGGKGKKREI